MIFRVFTVVLCLLSTSAWAKTPRLTLFISVDALSSDILLRNEPRLKGGLAQLVSQGAFFPTAQYEYAECVTAAGHTTLVTGTNPATHGIVSNRIYNRDTETIDRIFVDPAYPLLEAPLKATDDTSPRNLLAETLADRLTLSTRGKGKAISVTLKGRSAIPMAGQLGKAFWFHEGAGKFITGTYYSKAYPAWLKAFNERKLPESYFGKSWTLLAPSKDYAGEDNRPIEQDFLGLGRAFPHPLTAGLPSVGVPFFEALVSTPMMNDVLAEFSVAAIKGEALGKDDAPDVLFIGFSGLDHMYHHFGPYSWEMQDALLRLDRALTGVFSAAEQAAGGKDNLLIVLSADHGGSALPEEWIAQGLTSARVRESALMETANKELASLFGVSKLVVALDEVDVYLNHKLIADKKLDLAAIRRALAAILMRQPGIESAISRDDLALENDKEWLVRAFRQGFHPARSGDVLVMTRVHHVMTDEPSGASHGTPYAYDSQVPVIFAGSGVRSGRYRQKIPVTAIAPTVSALLNMAPPAQAFQSPLTEVISAP